MANYVDYNDSSSDCSLSFSDSDDDSYHSYDTQSTATTNYSSARPSVAEEGETPEKPTFLQKNTYPSFRDSGASFASYPSSVDSQDDLNDEAGEYQVAPAELEVYHSDAIPSTPQDFAELFPSKRELFIAHDDATIDGNMNLRVDTIVANDRGEEKKIILYHLKMVDLKTRKCSLRRYCRDSGREICHSAIRSQAPETKNKFSFARSISSALSFRSKTDVKSLHAAGLRRQDSGYDSINSADDETSRPYVVAQSAPAVVTDNVVSLEFSNYAHLDVRRQGFGSEKRYDFEYWGVSYSWQKTQSRQGGVSYKLVRHKDHALVAHIATMPLTDAEAQEEIEQGGWVPPCSMQIDDQHVIDASGDVSDVVVATGLLTLVDDSIRRRFQSRTVTQLVLPSSTPSLSPRNLDFISPKRLIDEAFGRGKRANYAI